MARKIYDVHSHFVTKEYFDAVRDNFFTEDGFPLVSTWTAEAHLDFVEQAGIDWSLLSMSSPHPHYHNDKKCIGLMRRMNEEIADLKRKYPDKFGFAAALPHPNNDAALEEAIYALDELGADAIKLASNSRGLYMGDPAMEPLFEELNKRNTVIIMHPQRPAQISEDVFSAAVAPMFEFVCDSTRAVLNVIANGVLERYPNIKLVVPHNGSFLPNLYPRLKLIMELLAKQDIVDPIDVEKSYAKLYFDTSGNPNPNTEFLLTCANPKQIMYGSDFPFTPGPTCIKMLESTKEYFANNEKIAPYQDDIFSDTCKQLFNLD